MARESIAPEPRGDGGYVRLSFPHQVHDAGHFPHDTLDLQGEGAKRLQVIAEDLHRHVRPRSREHVIDPVRDRLPDADVGSRNQGRPTADIRKDLGNRPLLQREAHIDFRRLDALQMLVQLRPARPSRRQLDFRNRQEASLQRRSVPVGFLQARTRHRNRADRQRTLVERG